MDKEDIIKLAREAGIGPVYGYESIERFAALVAAAENEACAKVCEDAISGIGAFYPEYVNQVSRNVCTNLAATIRARGQV